MTSSMKMRYLAHYAPLARELSDSLVSADLKEIEKLPQPFFPLFGSCYERSALKIIFIGQDTRGWGNTSEFLKNPEDDLNNKLDMFDSLAFRSWGKTTHTFFGFAMALLASVHGIKEWNVLKYKGHEDILRSFAWGNANSVELFESITKYNPGVPFETWHHAHQASRTINRFAHIHKSLTPRVVILTTHKIIKEDYFKGYHLIQVPSPNTMIEHFKISGNEIDVFQTRHPNSMRHVGSPRDILISLRRVLEEHNLAPTFPDFSKDAESAEEISGYLAKNCPTSENKYDFVTWVADELSKRGACMSVPCLAALVNQVGYKTNYGTEFSGKRGTYRLVRGAYNRQSQNQEAADKIALAFRKPDFTYAYK